MITSACEVLRRAVDHALPAVHFKLVCGKQNTLCSEGLIVESGDVSILQSQCAPEHALARSARKPW